MCALLHLALFAWFASSPGAAESAPVPAEPQTTETGSQQIRSAYLRIQGTSYEAVRQALAVRAPELIARDSTREALDARGGEPWAFVDVRPYEGGFEITLILADGRGYDRAIDADEGDGPRTIAVTIANLLAAIAEDRIIADRSDAVVPEDLAKTEVSADIPATPEPETFAPPTTPRPPPPPPRWSLGPSLGAAFVLGLGPPTGAGALSGVGGAAGFRLLSPRRWASGVDLRLLGLRHNGYQLLRFRVTGRFGYLLRRRRFALDLLGRIGVEPWRVSGDDGRVAVHTGESEVVAPGLLLTASLHVAPGVRLVDGQIRVVLGLPIELGYAGVPDRGLRTARILLLNDGGGEDLFRIGGIELGFGVELALEFNGPRARAR